MTSTPEQQRREERTYWALSIVCCSLFGAQIGELVSVEPTRALLIFVTVLAWNWCGTQRQFLAHLRIVRETFFK